MSDTPAYPQTPRSRARRKPTRARYDEASVHAVLDAALLCHVGYVIEGQPFVTPTAFWREGRRLYWHGSAASRMIRAQASGLPVCVTVSHLDGLVLAASGIAHSANYRSVMAFGRARLVEGLETRRAALEAFIDRLYPGRAETLRPMTDKEVMQVGLIEMTIEEAVAKQRAGGVNLLPEDEGWPVWTGVLPVSVQVGRPMAEAASASDARSGAGFEPYAEGERLDDALSQAAGIWAA